MRRFAARLALVIALALAAPPAGSFVASLVGVSPSDQAQASDCAKKPSKHYEDGVKNKPLCPPPPPPGG